MKKIIFTLLLAIIFVTGIALLLNIQVTTKQGVNYEVQLLKIPLYLKIIDFYDRNFNYAELAKKVVKGAKGNEQKVMKIFFWTKEHIRHNPESLPVIDDHVWHIIVRGYGMDDQFQDVFTTLCNYSGVDAFFDYFKDKTGKKKPLSMVKIEGEWCVFDAYNGIYFRNNQGQIASIKDILKDNYQLAGLINMKSSSTDYKEYFYALASLKYDDWYYYHSAIQFPLRRLIFWGKKKK